MKKNLSSRLRLLSEWTDRVFWQDALSSKVELRSDADNFDRANVLLSNCFKRGLLVLSCYYSEDASVREQTQRFILEANDFLHGNWREQFDPPDGRKKPDYWKREFPWMCVFELCLLWGSSLPDWDMLAKVGVFPEEDSYIDFSHKEHDRDLLLAIGAFCAGRPVPVVTSLLEKSIGGRSQKCRLAAEVLKSIVARDGAAASKGLVKYMKYHEAKEFPKKDMLCKISILGTFLYHAANRAGMDVSSVEPYLDYIVRLAPPSPSLGDP